MFGGITGFSEPTFFCCESDACCGPYVAASFSLAYEDASDDTGILAYHVRRNGTLIYAGFGRTGTRECEGVPWARPQGNFFGDGSFRVTAVDLAGNEDDNVVELAITVDCAVAPWMGGTCDGGPPGAPDAAPGAPDASDAPDAGTPGGESDAAGCGCRTMPRTATPWSIVLLLVAWLAGRARVLWFRGA